MSELHHMYAKMAHKTVKTDIGALRLFTFTVPRTERLRSEVGAWTRAPPRANAQGQRDEGAPVPWLCAGASLHGGGTSTCLTLCAAA